MEQIILLRNVMRWGLGWAVRDPCPRGLHTGPLKRSHDGHGDGFKVPLALDAAADDVPTVMVGLCEVADASAQTMGGTMGVVFR